MGKEKALEAYLVVAARMGDRASMARLIALRGPRLMAHAVRLLGEVEGARDVTQDAWLEIMRGIKGLRDETAFLPWALRIVTRRVARVIKGRQRDRKLTGDYAVEADISSPETGPTAVLVAEIRRAIAALPPAQAATIALFYLEDLRVTEVALALDVPVGTIKTRLMHARNKLRSILEGEKDE